MGQIIAYVLFTILAVLGAKWFIQKDGHPKGLFYLFFAHVRFFAAAKFKTKMTTCKCDVYSFHVNEQKSKYSKTKRNE